MSLLYDLFLLNKKRGFIVALCIFIVVFAYGMRSFTTYAERNAAHFGMPKVETYQVTSQQARAQYKISGRLESTAAADIYPQVGGILRAVLFQEGQKVEIGTPLFTIDPRDYEAAAQAAAARLNSAEASYNLAKIEHDRSKALLHRKVVAQNEYDRDVNKMKMAAAEVEAATAELTRANLNLQYAHVVAPIEGRIGRAEIKVGNLLALGQTQRLAQIITTSPIYAELNMDEGLYLNAFHHFEQQLASTPIAIIVEGKHYQGKIQSFDNHVDQQTGTIRLRAIVENPDEALVPGMFINAEIGAPETEEMILIPERAIGTNQDRKFVYVLQAAEGEGNGYKVALQPVELGGLIGDMRAVRHGLKTDDLIVLSGIHKIRPGMIVAVTQEAKEATQ